ncbi:hypothetical protein [Clostridium sporogenes]|uniref:hypothetical protein n=1 Tax=Clostridium sporogenes TaxID=1509 RepID=UPI0013D5D68C|nr:hypothetical protein [Clostridium sporogenes]NFP92698.1 hypothetical protein [Clostridium sporogenes]
MELLNENQLTQINGGGIPPQVKKYVWDKIKDYGLTWAWQHRKEIWDGVGKNTGNMTQTEFYKIFTGGGHAY